METDTETIVTVAGAAVEMTVVGVADGVSVKEVVVVVVEIETLSEAGTTAKVVLGLGELDVDAERPVVES